MNKAIQETLNTIQSEMTGDELGVALKKIVQLGKLGNNETKEAVGKQLMNFCMVNDDKAIMHNANIALLNLYWQGHVNSAQYAYKICKNMDALYAMENRFIAQILEADETSLVGVETSSIPAPKNYYDLVNFVGESYIDKSQIKPMRLSALVKYSKNKANNKIKETVQEKEMEFRSMVSYFCTQPIAEQNEKTLQKTVKQVIEMTESDPGFSRDLALVAEEEMTLFAEAADTCTIYNIKDAQSEKRAEDLVHAIVKKIMPHPKTA